MPNPLKRQSKPRAQRRTMCIVVEGQRTEKRYFQDASAEFNQNGVVRLNVEPANGGSPAQILDKAIQQTKLGHEKIWCILDADTFETKADHQKLAQALRCKIEVIFSNPCFEVWYRLHFTNSHGALTNGDAAKAEVKRLMEKHIKVPRSDWLALREILRAGTPVRNAAAVKARHGIPPSQCLLANSSTDVDIVLHALGF